MTAFKGPYRAWYPSEMIILARHRAWLMEQDLSACTAASVHTVWQHRWFHLLEWAEGRRVFLFLPHWCEDRKLAWLCYAWQRTNYSGDSPYGFVYRRGKPFDGEETQRRIEFAFGQIANGDEEK